MPITTDQTTDLLYDHYKDTFREIRTYTSNRNKLFLYVLLIFAAMQIINPGEAPSIMADALKESFGVSPVISVQAISALLWLSLLYCLARYLQVTLTIDSQYGYLHTLESYLADSFTSFSFNRERLGYGEDFKGLRNAIFLFYRAIVPVVFLILVIWRLHSEYRYLCKFEFGYVIDCLLGLASATVIILYVVESLKSSQDENSEKQD